MSSIYVLEPPTKGKVVLKTTCGALDVELWPKEAPKAVRNFLQLCVDGYYDNTIFHRIIKTFMIQGGDPMGTGTGGDTIYGEPFGDEFHSRLRFNHRGLMACANAGSPNTNNSQFFITLDRCDWLDKKHTIFGKVTGDTVYNLMKLGEVETGADDRPKDPPKIISVEVLWNPFDDMVARDSLKSIEALVEVIPPKRGKKMKRELNLLSFGEEAEDEEQQLATAKEKKIQSSHDVLQDPRLLKSQSDASQMDPAEAERRTNVQTSVRQALAGHVKVADTVEQREKRLDSVEGEEGEADFDRKMREKIMERRRMHVEDQKPAKKASRQEASSTSTSKMGPPSSRGNESRSKDESVGPKKEKLVLKKNVAAATDLDMQMLSPLEQQRMKYKQMKKTNQSRENNTLAMLEKFKKKLVQAKEAPDRPSEATDEDADDAKWMTHRLKFEVDPSKKDDMSKNDDPNQYVVEDPLLEKGKEKFNKMQAKMKRRNREWAGNSVT